MSRLTETHRAYEKIKQLIDRELLAHRGTDEELRRFQATLDVAFYLLGWAQFEHLVRKEAEDKVDERAAAKTVERHAWKFVKDNIKSVSVRQRLDIIFHGDVATRNALDKDYTVRNEAAHNYKQLPPEARDLSAWLEKLEELVDKFDK